MLFPFTVLLLAAIEIGLMFGCLYLMLKFFKSRKDAMQILSSLAIASIPWSRALFVMAILMLALGASGISGMVILMLIIFAAVSSICLLEISLHDDGISNLNNLLIISVSYAVQFVLFLYFAQSISSDFLFSLSRGLLG